MIFVSHARRDSPVTDMFVEKVLRLGFGIRDKSIFYTSHPDTEISGGKYINGEIFKALKKSKLIIIFLSKNYFDSAYCLCEMGAAKLLHEGKPVFLFLLPGLNYSEVEGVFSENMIKSIDSNGMDNFTDCISESCESLITSRASAPGRRINDFLSSLDNFLLDIEHPETVSFAEFNALKKQYENMEVELNQAEDEVESQKKYIQQLEKLKSTKDIDKIKPQKSHKVEDVYEEIREIAESELGQLSSDGKISFFYFWRYDELDASRRILRERLDIDSDVDELFFLYNGEGFELGESSSKIMSSLQDLNNFLEGSDMDYLCKQYGFKEKEWEEFRSTLAANPLQNITYWRENLF